MPPILYGDQEVEEEDQTNEIEHSIDAKSVDNDSVKTPRTDPEEEVESGEKVTPMKLNSKRLGVLNSINKSIEMKSIGEKTTQRDKVTVTQPDVIFETRS